MGSVGLTRSTRRSRCSRARSSRARRYQGAVAAPHHHRAAAHVALAAPGAAGLQHHERRPGQRPPGARAQAEDLEPVQPVGLVAGARRGSRRAPLGADPCAASSRRCRPGGSADTGDRERGHEDERDHDEAAETAADRTRSSHWRSRRQPAVGSRRVPPSPRPPSPGRARPRGIPRRPWPPPLSRRRTRISPSARIASKGVCPGRMPMSPSEVRAMRAEASPVQSFRSTLTTST